MRRATILATAGSKGLCLFAAGTCKSTIQATLKGGFAAAQQQQQIHSPSRVIRPFIRPFIRPGEWANEGSEEEGGELGQPLKERSGKLEASVRFRMDSRRNAQSLGHL